MNPKSCLVWGRQLRSASLSLCWLLLAFAPALSREAAAEPLSSPPLLVVPDAARATPGFDVERATEAYMDLISPEARASSDAYFEGDYLIDGLDWLWTIGVSLLMLGGGRARRTRDAIAARIGRVALADLATAALYLVAASLLTLPFDLWRRFFREHAYGLSNQTFLAWLRDWGVELGVGVLLTAPAIAAFYAVARRAPRTWWIWGTGLAALFLVFGVAIAPVFVNPLFNDYKPLEQSALRDEILSLARSHRIPADDVFWFDASRQSKRISANVSGFAGTMRISLNDNLLQRSPRESVLAVLGHEMGHFVLNHVVELILELSLVLFAGFACVHFGFERARRRFGAGWRLEGMTDPAGLPLAILLLATFLYLTSPVTNSIIRSNEAEADAFGLAISGQPDGFALAAVQLSEYRKMRPGQLEEILFYDHPSGYDRIRRSMQWKAEHLEQMAARERGAGGGSAPALEN